MISVEVNLAMFWAPSTDAEGLQATKVVKQVANTIFAK